ncbi:hypothetical protein [Mesorhizobium retamae]|uniref:Uncharacterized protein n=1 Tax=Mesorhizobium retamae TaxID=2912854 RepID=A0ABS9QQB4_9HYPH|nr:hypothetical protein [Mesorhizobium sp. IRAMC:0171]MCG7509038.1 hypothetical protein [Mesorhizobium sp. IRAMC:0171]
MKHDFADDLRGPDPRALPFFTRKPSRRNDPTDRLHRAVMIALAAAIALLAAFIFTCFAWAVA